MHCQLCFTSNLSHEVRIINFFQKWGIRFRGLCDMSEVAAKQTAGLWFTHILLALHLCAKDTDNSKVLALRRTDEKKNQTWKRHRISKRGVPGRSTEQVLVLPVWNLQIRGRCRDLKTSELGFRQSKQEWQAGSTITHGGGKRKKWDVPPPLFSTACLAVSFTRV